MSNSAGDAPDVRHLIVRPTDSASAPALKPASFLTVAAAARVLCVSEMTLYRAIRDEQFPAVRIRGRLIIPGRVIEALIEESIDRNGAVDGSAGDRIRGSGAGQNSARTSQSAPSLSTEEVSGRAGPRPSRSRTTAGGGE